MFGRSKEVEKKPLTAKELLNQSYIRPGASVNLTKNEINLTVVTRQQLIDELYKTRGDLVAHFRPLMPRFKIEVCPGDFKWRVYQGYLSATFAAPFNHDLNIMIQDGATGSGIAYDIEVLDSLIAQANEQYNLSVSDLMQWMSWGIPPTLTYYDTQALAKKALDIFTKKLENDGTVIQYYNFPPLTKVK